MNRKLVFILTLTLLIGTLSVAFSVQMVKASGSIYIRADGGIDPPTAPITTVDNVTYTFAGNVNDSIIVERDSIMVDGQGYTVQGTGSGTGIILSARSNVTIKNTEITAFNYGIVLISSSNNSFSGNNITANSGDGIYLGDSSYNTIVGNNITNNRWGIDLVSSNNRIYHNNFVNNTWQVDSYKAINAWDDGYPSGENYWSNYNGTDANHDGIGDNPQIIDANNTDHYPLMNPYIIPEFPSFLILPLFFIATLLAVAICKRKRNQEIDKPRIILP